MIPFRFPIIFWAFILSMPLASCEDSTTIIDTSFDSLETTISIQMGELSFGPQEEVYVMDAIHNRRAIAGLNFIGDYCVVAIQDRQPAYLKLNTFPVLSLNDNLTWLLKGTDIGVPARHDPDGNLIPPSVSPGDNGIWVIDGIATSLLTGPYLQYHGEASPGHLMGLAEFGERMFVYDSDGKIHSVPIIKDAFYRVHEHWLEHLNEKEKLSEKALEEMDGDGVSFIFITDTHWGKNAQKSPAIIRHILQYTPISDVIFGGDAITSHSTNLATPMETGKDFQKAFSFLGTHFHCIYGNHDNNSDEQVSLTQYHLTDEQVYSWLQSHMTDVVFGEHFNFYYDNPEAKTRIICLDTGRYYYVQFWDKLPQTVRFAVESLASMPEGWHAIMASHIWCSDRKLANGTYSAYVETFARPILTVFENYNHRKKGTYTYSGVSVPYDFTNAGGFIEFCIGGHTHGQYTTSSEGGIPIIIVTSDYSRNLQLGTLQEQGLAIVVADYKNRKMKLFAIGKGKDCIIDL